jgi:tetratricopeptide (TPR) repeat protein
MFHIRSTYLYTSLLLLLTFVIYAQALNVPFYLDDYDSIVNNEVIRSINLPALSQFFPMREVGYLSFAINYQLTNLDVGSFRLTNVILHSCMGGLVYLLSLALFKYASYERQTKHVIATVAMGLFLLSPLNSQAVIYIVQRLAIVTAIFYVVGIIAYLKFRLASNPRHKLSWVLLLIASFALGIHSKQNFVTLPLVILALEFFVINPKSMEKLPKYFVATFFFALLVWLADFLLQSNLLNRIDALTTEAERVTRWEYFTHQLTAIWIYIIKFFVPSPLLLEYSSTPWTWSNDVTWYSLMGHIILLTIAVKLSKKQPVIAVLIFGYYIAHLVESSFIPISDLMFEHRAYLPNVFLAILCAMAIARLAQYKKWLPVVMTIGISVASSFVIAKRIDLWQEPIELYRHELTYTADNSRVYGSLGALFAQQGEFKKAENWYKGALEVGLNTGHLQASAVIHYLRVLIQNDRIPQASRIGVQSLNILDKPADKAEILLLLARLKAEQGLCGFSDGLVARANKVYPKSIDKPEIECIERAPEQAFKGKF